ncbi:YjcZ family sporulation protein [Bacillus sp. NTK071]|uniref:YjcZ family sporulation protein n=1 Tax=Bacillus sp. NTK071 TaxID=2802175 RepID=UPI00256FC0DD|nr:YjcZ family sporulation protein [Bacillus sp. NTK071]
MGYGYGYGCGNQVGPANCGYPVGGARYGNGFALIVVLFILLIIIGASFVKGNDC